MVTEFDDQLGAPDPHDVFTVLVEVARARVRGVDSVSVTSHDGSRFATVAATAEQARNADQLQYDQGAGPCIAAVLEDRVCQLEDLRSDDRWPARIRGHAETLGVLSALSMPLAPTGAPNLAVGLNLYSGQPGGFDAEAVGMTALLVTHARIALLAADQAVRVLNLERSHQSTQLIGAAVGVLMATRDLGHDQARDLLRSTSQRTNTRTSDLAAQVVATGTLPRMKNRPPRGDPRGHR